MPVELQFAEALKAEHRELVEKWSPARAMGEIARCTASDVSSREVCLRFCEEDESADLNRTYRGYDKPTNVLSFPAAIDLPTADPLPLGDLAICIPVVIQESVDQEKSLNNHLTHLFVHGVLHLLGYDHENDRDAESMEAVEVEILAALGIRNPYCI